MPFTCPLDAPSGPHTGCRDPTGRTTARLMLLKMSTWLLRTDTLYTHSMAARTRTRLPRPASRQALLCPQTASMQRTATRDASCKTRRLTPMVQASRPMEVAYLQCYGTTTASRSGSLRARAFPETWTRRALTQTAGELPLRSGRHRRATRRSSSPPKR